MPNEPRTNYIQLYKNELDKIDRLEQVPKLIKLQATAALDKVLKEKDLKNTAKVVLVNAKKSLNNIGDSSLKDSFKTIYAQMCILAVSSLEALLKTYFERVLDNPSRINRDNKRLKEMKISLIEVLDSNLKFGGKFGKLVVEKDKPNFQDLKSIKNIFQEYFNKNIQINSQTEKEICFYLELRHVLVHKGGTVDEKFISSTTSFDANIKNYTLGSKVEVEEADWQQIKEVFTQLVVEVTKNA